MVVDALVAVAVMMKAVVVFVVVVVGGGGVVGGGCWRWCCWRWCSVMVVVLVIDRVGGGRMLVLLVWCDVVWWCVGGVVYQ